MEIQNVAKEKIVVDIPVRAKKPARVETPPSKPLANQLSFRIDKTTNRVVVSILDPDTGDVVRQIPPEETMVFLRRMNEMLQHQVDQVV